MGVSQIPFVLEGNVFWYIGKKKDRKNVGSRGKRHLKG